MIVTPLVPSSDTRVVVDLRFVGGSWWPEPVSFHASVALSTGDVGKRSRAGALRQGRCTSFFIETPRQIAQFWWLSPFSRVTDRTNDASTHLGWPRRTNGFRSPPRACGHHRHRGPAAHATARLDGGPSPSSCRGHGWPGSVKTAGDRTRTGDIQLGKQ